MGLAGPKNRFKLSHDPNNTTWSRNTARFGHRILTSQGWTPGTHLGAADAAHATHHTVASFSHIKVLLKDDNLGLGAKRGSERAENFGMAGFDDLLARLNGKSEEKIKETQNKRRDAETKVFHSQRWGSMTFVSGGYLVGDQIVKGKAGEIPTGGGAAMEVTTEKPSKKRKRTQEPEHEGLEAIAEEEAPRLKKKKRKSNLREEAAEGQSASEPRKKSKKHDESPQSSRGASPPSGNPVSDKASRKAARAAEKAARRAEKASRKAEKAARKEAKKLKKSKSTDPLPAPSTATFKPDLPAEVTSKTTDVSTATTFTQSARHAARRRYIQAKRSAIMDPQALKEIFMIKGQG